MSTAPDFSNLLQYHVSDETLAEYTFSQIKGDPSIWCAPALDENKLYQSERLRPVFEESEDAGAAKKKTEKLTAVTLAQQIDKDRETARRTLAKACAKRWGTPPIDAKGNTPEFSEANCLAFLTALPNDMFDAFHNWAQNPYYFRPANQVTDAAAEALGNA